MTIFRFSNIVAALALSAASIGSATAATYTEDFNAAFPTWESSWFGTNSTARNYYCNGALGCTSRGNNPDGLWIIGSAGVSAPVEVSFASGFGDSLTSFTLDVAGYSPTTLSAYDKNNALIFSENVSLTRGALSNPGVYSTYTITSTTGISRFAFSGSASGNTSIDNLIAVTSAVPEPETYALMLAGLAAVGFAAKRRRA